MARDRSADSRIHDYSPVNKYIDEQARIRRTRSVWGYTRSIALSLAALGIFLLLLALAYWIFNKPYQTTDNQTQIEIDNREEVSAEDLENSQEEIEAAEKQIQEENQKIENEIVSAENSIDIIEKENKDLKQDRDMLKDQLNNSELTNKEEQELTDKIVNLDKEINKNDEN